MSRGVESLLYVWSDSPRLACLYPGLNIWLQVGVHYNISPRMKSWFNVFVFGEVQPEILFFAETGLSEKINLDMTAVFPEYIYN